MVSLRDTQNIPKPSCTLILGHFGLNIHIISMLKIFISELFTRSIIPLVLSHFNIVTTLSIISYVQKNNIQFVNPELDIEDSLFYILKRPLLLL